MSVYMALDSPSPLVRLQLLELLAALSLFHPVGRQLTLDALLSRQARLGGGPGLLRGELRASRSAAYSAAILGLVNVLLLGEEGLQARVHLRHQLIGLQLLEELPQLRGTGDLDLEVQLEAFLDCLVEDQEQLEEDQGDPQVAFSQLLSRVCGRPSAPRLLALVQVLLQVDPDRVDVWAVLETLAGRASLLAQDSQPGDALLERLLPHKTRPANQSRATVSRAAQTDQSEPRTPPPAQDSPGAPPPVQDSPGIVAPPPLPGMVAPPPLPGIVAPSPSSPPYLGVPSPSSPLTWDGSPSPSSHFTWDWGPSPSSPFTWDGSPSPSSPFTWDWSPSPSSPFTWDWSPSPSSPFTWDWSPSPSSPFTWDWSPSPSSISPAPCPSLRMKKLNWQKLPSRALADHSSLWTGPSDPLEPDYSSIQQLFSLPAAEPRTRTRTEPQQISFIDAKKSLNLNIFLRQFRCSHEDFVSLILKGDRAKFDVEVLKQLIKLLPDKHEVENLKSHRADRDRLESVDQFYLLLMDVPSYELRLDCMLLCEQSSVLLETLQPRAELLDRACQGLMESRRLSSFCRLVLSVGNFLNYGTHTGNAEGFRISTLLKLTETKANQSRITLLHHILEEVERDHPDLLKLPEDLQTCEQAAGLSLEVMRSECSSLIGRLQGAERRLSSSPKDLRDQHLGPVQALLLSLGALGGRLSSLGARRVLLADYLCEDAAIFSLEELLTTVGAFRGHFLRALQVRGQSGARGHFLRALQVRGQSGARGHFLRALQ
ncbi:inverted formin-2-like, partial [Menidia menidia]